SARSRCRWLHALGKAPTRPVRCAGPAEIGSYEQSGVPMPLRLGRTTLEKGQFAVMAIVNRTPDSFFDNGATYSLSAALDRVDEAVSEGATIVDVGGVKAGRGGFVDVDEELRRTADLVSATRSQHPDLVISVDTWRGGVA